MPTVLDLRKARATIEALAAPLTEAGAKVGLVISPRETRFVRLATFVGYPGTENGVGGATFHGSARNENLVMVYFDRPCRVSGVSHRSQGSVLYDVEVAQRGLTLLKIVRDSSTSGHVAVTTLPSTLLLAVTPAKFWH